ncbi:MAG TPA: class I SAM-dependent methyltransferase [Solirubrobacteraceae bacterium]|nr:class I SAM-dependent methyltransferase [Solirubrobacteraceae bacterium]
MGEILLGQLIAVGGLKPTDRVLDVGCGSGRTAVPLSGYLDGGSYAGFDIHEPAIRWCRATITPRHPSFAFRVLDVANTHYNPGGGLDAARLEFPYPAEAFDFALATSVFTHMLPAGFVNYAAELGRVLAPGGVFFGTFFLLNAESAGALDRGTALIDLPTEGRDPATGVDYRAMDARSPETVIALPEEFVAAGLRRAGLELTAVRFGQWTGRTDGLAYQDIVVARRPL